MRLLCCFSRRIEVTHFTNKLIKEMAKQSYELQIDIEFYFDKFLQRCHSGEYTHLLMTDTNESGDISIEQVESVKIIIPERPIILIIDSKKDYSQFLEDLIVLKIYYGLFDKDATISKITEYLTSTQSSEDAKNYYMGKRQNKKRLKKYDIESINSFLESSHSDEELYERFDYIIEKYNSYELMLNGKLLKRLVYHSKYMNYFITDKEQIDVQLEDIQTKEDLKQVVKDLTLEEKKDLGLINTIIEQEQKILDKLIVGVIQTSKGCGGTYLSILLANYLKLKNKVAVIELNDSDSFNQLFGQYNSSKNHQMTLYQVDYYRNVDDKSLIDLFQKEYDCIILDIGNWQVTDYFKEFLRANIKIVVSPGVEWKFDEVRSFHQENKHLNLDNLYYLLPLARKNYVLDLREELEERRVLILPFHQNPYKVKNNDSVYSTFSKIIKLNPTGHLTNILRLIKYLIILLVIIIIATGLYKLFFMEV